MPPPSGEGHSARCPRCAHELWKQRDGEWTLANKILKLTAAGVVARCPNTGCGTDVPISFLTMSAAAPATAEPRRRLIVRLDRPGAP